MSTCICTDTELTYVNAYTYKFTNVDYIMQVDLYVAMYMDYSFSCHFYGIYLQ